MGRSEKDMFEGLPRSEIERLINEWIVNTTHAQRNRQIMLRRYIDGLTYAELAEEFSLSDWQVKNICYECCKRINRH